MKKFFGIEDNSEKNKEIKLTHCTQGTKLTTEITREIGVGEKSINFIDILHNAIQESKDTFTTTILGTGQERYLKKLYNHKKIYSGPVNTSHHPSTKNSEIQGFGEMYLHPEEFQRQSKEPLNDFVIWVLKKSISESEIKIDKPLKWTIIGHSRGAVIARILANTQPKTIKINNGGEVVIECSHSTRTLTIYDNDKQIVRQYSLEISLLLFSATPGLGAKNNDDIIRLGPQTTLVDFIAAQDTGFKGISFKPLTHRRTFMKDGSYLFVFMPVYHSAVTKGLKKQNLHMEIELLISYLYMLYAGTKIDIDDLKLPSRTKTHTSKQTSILSMDLDQGRGFFTAKNCGIAGCLYYHRLQKNIYQNQIFLQKYLKLNTTL